MAVAGWTRTQQAAAGIIGLQQRSLTSPWTDGQTWSPKASISRKLRYNSPASLSRSLSLSYVLSRPPHSACSAWQSRPRVRSRGLRLQQNGNVNRERERERESGWSVRISREIRPSCLSPALVHPCVLFLFTRASATSDNQNVDLWLIFFFFSFPYFLFRLIGSGTPSRVGVRKFCDTFFLKYSVLSDN